MSDERLTYRELSEVIMSPLFDVDYFYETLAAKLNNDTRSIVKYGYTYIIDQELGIVIEDAENSNVEAKISKLTSDARHNVVLNYDSTHIRINTLLLNKFGSLFDPIEHTHIMKLASACATLHHCNDNNEIIFDEKIVHHDYFNGLYEAILNCNNSDDVIARKWDDYVSVTFSDNTEFNINLTTGVVRLLPIFNDNGTLLTTYVNLINNVGIIQNMKTKMQPPKLHTVADIEEAIARRVEDIIDAYVGSLCDFEYKRGDSVTCLSFKYNDVSTTLVYFNTATTTMTTHHLNTTVTVEIDDTLRDLLQTYLTLLDDKLLMQLARAII